MTGHVEETSRIQRIDRDDSHINEDIGLTKIFQEFSSNYTEKLDAFDKLIDLQKRELIRISKPRLIVEGVNDLKTLSHAWFRLFVDPLPFEVKAAEGANRVTHQITVWPEISEKRVLALYDHDIEGIKAIGKLHDYRKRGFVKDVTTKLRKVHNGRRCTSDDSTGSAYT